MGLGSAVRWVRAASFAAACAVLGAAGHAAGGGRVDRSALAAGFLLTFAAALALTRRERTIVTITPALAVVQVVLHVLLGQADPGHAAAMSHAGHAGATATAMPEAHGGSGPGMLLMHAAAVLVASWWLECGEARLCALVRRLARWALRPFARVRPAPADGPVRPAPARRGSQAALRAVILRHVVVRRGPPDGMTALG